MLPKRFFSVAVILVLTVSGCDLTTGRDEQTEPKPARGGTITVAITDTPSLDPSKAADRNPEATFSINPSLLVINQICDPLVAFHPATGRLEGLAAESWSYSEDGKKITFKLREGVRFHNGREVVAEDYVYAISRFVHKDSGTSRRYWFQRLAGYQEAVDGKTPTVAGVKAIDPRTLEFELAEPFAELPAVLSNAAAGSALPKEEVDKGAFATHPICTGPYALKEARAPGGPITLKRAEGYAGEHPFYSADGAGYADEIQFTIVPNLDEGYKLLDDRKADVAEVPLNEQLNNARRVEGRMEQGPNGHVAYIGYPVTKAGYTNPEFRRALSLAADRKLIIENLLAGSRLMPNGFLPGSAGPASRSVCKQSMASSGDQKRAQAALSAAAVDPASIKPRVHYNDGGSGHGLWLAKVAEAWKANLGLDSELVAHEEELLSYLDFLAEGGQDGPFRLAWSVEYPSPEALFGSIFQGGSLDNFTGYASPEFDDLLKQARASTDTDDRISLYVKAADVLCRDVPASVMWFGASHIAFSNRIVSGGNSRIDIFGYPLLREMGERSR
jgi:oligopeptide transport system substrate-binding protein